MSQQPPKPPVPPVPPVPGVPPPCPYPHPRLPPGAVHRTTGPFLDDTLRPLPTPVPPGPPHPDARIPRPWRAPWFTTVAVFAIASVAFVWAGLASVVTCKECDPAAAAAADRGFQHATYFLLGGLGVAAVALLGFWLTPPRERERGRRTGFGAVALTAVVLAAGLASASLAPVG